MELIVFVAPLGAAMLMLAAERGLKDNPRLAALVGSPAQAHRIASWCVVCAALSIGLSFWIAAWWPNWIRLAVTGLCIAMIVAERRMYRSTPPHEI